MATTRLATTRLVLGVRFLRFDRLLHHSKVMAGRSKYASQLEDYAKENKVIFPPLIFSVLPGAVCTVELLHFTQCQAVGALLGDRMEPVK